MKQLAYITFFISLVNFGWAQEKSITQHSVDINGESLNYTAEVSTLPLLNDHGEAIANIQYTYYTKKSKAYKTRPLVISFNGGPGSGSVWMHLAYTGPRVLKISDEGFPVQPYGHKQNPFSILDVADIVYVNPVNTGYSRPVLNEKGEFDKSKFFGVNADINYLSEWINTFVTKKDKWLAPKFLIGESYGTTRVSGLANALQNQHWMYINGVILVSPTELGLDLTGPVEIANRLPYFAAAAWYHNKLEPNLQNKPILEMLKEVEDYTINILTPALIKGGFLKDTKKQQVANQMAKYAGIKPEIFLDNNLDVSYNLFWKTLKKNDGFTVGRLDSRYLGLDEKTAGTRPDYNAELTSWLQSFTPAINNYYRNELNYRTDLKYNMFGNVYPWDRTQNNNTGKQLRQAMAQNPSLNVMIQSGLFDGATTYFNAKYTMWHIDDSGKLKDRFTFKTYESGHMMYLRRDDLETANNDLREFILKSIPKENKPIKY
ncbi:S10 family peptidase [Psychroflexus sp. ALD_RP9]|uniref:S10 family peptidase n=1 Tax=Psychroflexus sp. ALD_RP9 TaxID=2777186 RepID=UPI001A8C8388|nr:carboxypeptidase [Psychroflexus sp. ALD_RP9]QSS97716.1 carboxypeptidase [Psychroflexus sp. ALD_RP9]